MKKLFNNEISIENRSVLEEYLFGFDYRTSGLCYTSLNMWRIINNFSWEMIGGVQFVMVKN